MTTEQKLVFISHVESDEALARAVADGIESAGTGIRAWFYERDTTGGLSYLIQIGEALDSAAAVVVLITDRALDSTQVTGEVVRAYESGTPFIPVLLGITHEEFRDRQPLWRQALGELAFIYRSAVKGYSSAGSRNRDCSGAECHDDLNKGIDTGHIEVLDQSCL